MFPAPDRPDVSTGPAREIRRSGRWPAPARTRAKKAAAPTSRTSAPEATAAAAPFRA